MKTGPGQGLAVPKQGDNSCCWWSRPCSATTAEAALEPGMRWEGGGSMKATHLASTSILFPHRCEQQPKNTSKEREK